MPRKKQPRRRRLPTHPWMLWSVIIVGMILRIAYTIATPYVTRAYDAAGHMQYIEWVMQHWSVPPASLGMLTYHQPLFYFVAAAWGKLSLIIGVPQQMLTESLQTLSILISAGILLTCTWIGLQLFPKPKERLLAVLFAATAAALPAFVYFSSRIGNDAPFTLCAFLCFGFLLRWWKAENGWRDWYLSVMFAGLAVLCKMNGLVLTVLPFLCLLASARRGKELAIAAVMGALMTTLFVGSVPVLRHLAHHEPLFGKIVANTAMLGTHMDIGTPDTEHLIALRPQYLVMHPFNDNFTDAQGRKYQWEYLMRSAFFGEWNFPKLLPLAIFLISSAWLFFLLMIGGAASRLRTLDDDCPVIMLLLLFLAAAVLMRTEYAFSCSQEFRYVTPLFIPVTYYTLRGLSLLKGISKTVFTALYWVFLLGCLTLVTGVMITG